MAEEDTTARESESNDGNEANAVGGHEKKVEYWLPVGAILLLAGLILLVAQLATDGAAAAQPTDGLAILPRLPARPNH